MHVGNSRADPECLFDAVARNFVADDVKIQWLVGSFSRHNYLYPSSARTFQQVGNLRRRKSVGFLVVHFQDHIAWTKARFVGRRSAKGRDHNGLSVPRADRHSNAEVVPLLIVTQGLKIFRIEKIGVRIQRAQHPGNGSLIDALVGSDLFGEVVFHQGVDAGEQLTAGFEFFLES